MQAMIDLLVARYDRAKQERAAFENHWQEISEVLSPGGGGFTETNIQQGTKTNSRVFDSTAIHANELLSSGFFSLLTSPSTPWFLITTSDPMLNSMTEIRQWLADVSRIMLQEIQRPSTGFATAMHELYLQHGAYGNGALFITEKQDRSSLLFQSLPLQETYFIESDEGFIDGVIRSYQRTAYQLAQRFGEEAIGEEVRKAILSNDPEKKFQCLHFIIPNIFGTAMGYHTESPYASIYLIPEYKHVLSLNGFEEQPFIATRFFKHSNETYGRGPGSTALSDILMLQEMVKVTLRSAQKAVDPPLMMPDQGFLKPPSTAAGRINYYRAGTEGRIEPIQLGGSSQLGYEFIQEIRNRIREVFYVDQLQLNIGPMMTATEVSARLEEKQRLMGPVTGRIAAEGLSPMLIRCFGLLFRGGKLPDPPAAFLDYQGRLRIVFTSPMFKVQEQLAANDLANLMQLITPLMAVDPTVMDAIHPQRLVAGLADMYNIEPKYLRTQNELDEMNAQKQAAQQQAQQADQMKNMGIGLNNLASAGATLSEGGFI